MKTEILSDFFYEVTGRKFYDKQSETRAITWVKIKLDTLKYKKIILNNL
jgi:hypothetical protein